MYLGKIMIRLVYINSGHCLMEKNVVALVMHAGLA